MGFKMTGQVKNLTHLFNPKAESILLRAYKQWDGGELRSAFRLFFAAAKLGDVTAQFDLGYFYDVGVGIKPNRSAAMYWYKCAYRHGQSSAASNIGVIFRDEGDTKQALAWFERAVRLGDADANLEIAKIYIGEKSQVEKAIPYLKHVIKAKARLDVTVASQEEAQRLLKKYSA
jgi:TPR repeat protein